MNEAARRHKVTTFKLTEALTDTLTVIAERDSCTKDAVIRRRIMLGLETDQELQQFHQLAAYRVAARVWQAGVSKPPDRHPETWGIIPPPPHSALYHGLDAEARDAAKRVLHLYQAADPDVRRHMLEQLTITERAVLHRNARANRKNKKKVG